MADSGRITQRTVERLNQNDTMCSNEEGVMPEISRFFGIVIAIFYDDHNPPHFYARYEAYKATIGINDLKILEGVLPPRVLGLVVEWATIHQKDLVREWELARDMKSLFPIEPLK